MKTFVTLIYVMFLTGEIAAVLRAYDRHDIVIMSLGSACVLVTFALYQDALRKISNL